MNIPGVWLKAAAFSLAAALILFPLTQAVVPPLVDLPNHLAKIHLALSLPDDPHLSKFYEYRWHIVPNLAQDFIGPTLTKIFGVYAAGRLFLAWSLLQIVFGVCLLRYAVQGTVGWWPLGAFVILYNEVLSWGFLNYLFASGLVLIFFAVWILVAERGALLRGALFFVILPVMFFLHLVATAILCLCIVSYQLEHLWTIRKSQLEGPDKLRAYFKEALSSGVPFIIVFVLWLASPTGQGEPLFRHQGFINFQKAIFSPFLMSGSHWDYGLAIAVLAVTGAALIARQVVVVKSLLLPCLCLLLLALVMPALVLGAIGMHLRIPFLLYCIFISGIEIRRNNPVFSTVAAVMISALFAIRLVSIGAQWQQFDVELQQFRSAIARIEPGSKVVTALDSYERKAWRGAAVRPEVFLHLSALVVIDAASFDPLVFSDPRHTNVTVRQPFAHIDALQGSPATTRSLNDVIASAANGSNQRDPVGNKRLSGQYWSHWHQDFDYLIRFSILVPRTKLDGPLTLVGSGTWFDLYKIERTRNKTKN